MDSDLPSSVQCDMRIAIIGAGMGGLTCALALAKKDFKDIHVYETAPGLGFVGAGIQLAPNLVRILTNLGCWENIEAEATDILETSIRDGATDKELTHVYMPNIREKYGFPHCTGHRASLADGLYQACKRIPSIHFHLGHTLVRIDSFEPKVRFTVAKYEENGGEGGGKGLQLTADVLLASDGVKSITRDTVLAQTGCSSEAQDTGQAAYRVLLPREKMEHSPEMMALLDSNQVTRWIGEKRHWIAYPIHSRKIYNMSSIQPDVNFASAPSMTYTTKGSKAAMLDVFSDFCPIIQDMLELVPDGEIVEWKLRIFKPLPTWVHGNVALLGDACHPTLPHLNQGAALAIEDAAVVAEVLAQAARIMGDHQDSEDPITINRCLKVYELLRKERTKKLVDLAAESGRVLHLGEGEAKTERDRLFADAKAAGRPVPDKWASPDVQEYIYSHDCIQFARENFAKLYHKLD